MPWVLIYFVLSVAPFTSTVSNYHTATGAVEFRDQNACEAAKAKMTEALRKNNSTNPKLVAICTMKFS